MWARASRPCGRRQCLAGFREFDSQERYEKVHYARAIKTWIGRNSAPNFAREWVKPKKQPQIKSAPNSRELWDARTALPQVCSRRKIRRTPKPVNSTFVPISWHKQARSRKGAPDCSPGHSLGNHPRQDQTLARGERPSASLKPVAKACYPRNLHERDWR